jgi:hypothetical protein
VDWQNFDVAEGFSGKRTFEITSDGSEMNLSTAAVTVVFKPSEAVEDDDDLAHVLTEGDGVTVTDPSAGLVEVEIPEVLTQAPLAWFYKVDVAVSGQGSDTAVAGWMTVQDV